MKLPKFLATLLLTGTFASVANTVSAQFVRQSGQPAVYYQYSPSNYCHVQSDAQMNAYGGFQQVQVGNPINLKGQFTGHCGWPNGFFRRSNEPEVYMMYGNSFIPNLGDKFCHVKDELQLGQLAGKTGYSVLVVEPSANFAAGRTYTNTCE